MEYLIHVEHVHVNPLAHLAHTWELGRQPVGPWPQLCLIAGREACHQLGQRTKAHGEGLVAALKGQGI